MIRHENIVLFMGASMAPPNLAIVTGVRRGMSLHQHTSSRGSIPYPSRVNIARQVSSSRHLSLCHAHNTHRNLTAYLPHNLKVLCLYSNLSVMTTLSLPSACKTLVRPSACKILPCQLPPPNISRCSDSPPPFCRLPRPCRTFTPGASSTAASTHATCFSRPRSSCLCSITAWPSRAPWVSTPAAWPKDSSHTCPQK